MAESNREPPVCPCGFWGSTQTSGLCSKCYKEMLKRKECSSGSSSSPASTIQPSNPIKVVVTPASPSHTSSNNLLPLASHAPTKWPKGKPKDGAEADDGTKDITVTGTHQDSKEIVGTETSQGGYKAFETPHCDTIENSQDMVRISESRSSFMAETKDFDPTPDPSIGPDCDQKSCGTPPADERGLSPERAVQKNKRKCFKCRCKLDLASCEIGRCKCDYIFCELHRLPEQHNCSYDHKEMGRQEARQKMISPKKQVGTSLKRLDSDL